MKFLDNALTKKDDFSEKNLNHCSVKARRKVQSCFLLPPFFFSAGHGTEGLAHARQTLYH